MNNDKSSFMHRTSFTQDTQKMTDINQNSFLSVRDRCNSISNSSRNISPITFFHDGLMTLPDIDFHNQCTAAQRRARAIATAPRRNRNDDDDDNEFDTKTSLLGLRKTSAVPIPKANDIRQTQSLTPIHHHDTNLSPRSPTDCACSHGTDYCHRSYSLAPSPNNLPLWRS